MPNPIPSTDVTDFLENVKDFDALCNGAGTYTDRFGKSRLTVDEFFRRTGYEVPVAFASGIVVSRVTQTVTYSGVTYHALATAIPFTTTGTFNAAQWEVISGVSRQELGAEYGSALVGAATYAQLRAYTGDATRIQIGGRANYFDGGDGIAVRTGSRADNGGTVWVDALGRSWERQFTGPVRAVWFEGYDRTGVNDSTAAIQNAITASSTGAQPCYSVSIVGRPRVTAPFTYTHMLSLSGEGSDGLFTNSFDRYPTAINCHAVSGYLFDQPDVVDGDGSLTLENLCFDGRSPATSANSTTWQGLVKGSNTGGTSVFYTRLRYVLVGYSNSATPIVDVSGAVFPDYDNVKFIQWPYGMAASGKGANILGTTVTFRKCYFSNLRQVAEFYDNMTDVVFEDAAIESCVTGVASLKTSVYFRGGYSENMGYDATGTGITTGLTPRSLGVSDSPAISGNVTNIFTCRYGQMIFDGFTLQNTTGGKKWFDGIGRSSTLGRGGRIELRGLNMAAGTINTLFADDADTPSSRADFEYVMDVGVSKTVVPVASARMLTSGSVPIQWNDGNVREVTVSDGLFTLPSSTLGLTSAPTIYPDVLGALVGDVVQKKKSAIQAGAETAWICTTAGTTGAKWDTKEFAPLSVSASVVNGGTMSIPVPLVEAGTVYEYDVLAATAAGTGTACALKLVIGHYASGSGMSSQTLSGSGISASYSHGNPITITNSSGATLPIYARLVSVGRTHA